MKVYGCAGEREHKEYIRVMNDKKEKEVTFELVGVKDNKITMPTGTVNKMVCDLLDSFNPVCMSCGKTIKDDEVKWHFDKGVLCDKCMRD